MKTVHLAPAHPALDTRVFHKECRSLVASGHDVTIVTCGAAEVVPGCGVNFVTIPHARNRRERFLLTPLRLLWAAWRLGADVYHAHDAEALPVAAVLSLRRGSQAVWDSHEDLPRLVAGRSWIPRPVRAAAAVLVRHLERLLVSRCALVISAEDEGAKRFPPDRTVVVRNYPLAQEFKVAAETPHDSRSVSAVYVGDLTRERGAVEMVRAIGAVTSELSPSLILGGRINQPGLARELEETAGWERTTFLGFLSREEVGDAMARARLGLLLLHPIRKYTEGAVAVKVFEYMAAGIPVVASDFGVYRDIVGRHRAGLLVDPLDVDAVREAIETLLRDPEHAEQMGFRGRRAVREEYSWDVEERTLIHAYRRLGT